MTSLWSYTWVTATRGVDGGARTYDDADDADAAAAAYFRRPGAAERGFVAIVRWRRDDGVERMRALDDGRRLCRASEHALAVGGGTPAEAASEALEGGGWAFDGD